VVKGKGEVQKTSQLPPWD